MDVKGVERFWVFTHRGFETRHVVGKRPASKSTGNWGVLAKEAAVVLSFWPRLTPFQASEEAIHK